MQYRNLQKVKKKIKKTPLIKRKGQHSPFQPVFVIIIILLLLLIARKLTFEYDQMRVTSRIPKNYKQKQ